MRENITMRAARFSAAEACRGLLEGTAGSEDIAHEVVRVMEPDTAYEWMLTFCQCVERAGATLDSTQRQLITQHELMEKLLDHAGLEFVEVETQGEEQQRAEEAQA